jgi:hypothetical protein
MVASKNDPSDPNDASVSRNAEQYLSRAVESTCFRKWVCPVCDVDQTRVLVWLEKERNSNDSESHLSQNAEQ